MSQTEIQQIQNRHRRNLAEAWGIAAGSRILEIGCGQGDMTAVLAEVVGPEGRVLAVDLASPDYGAPQTLAEATQLIQESPLGDRVEFRFKFDVLSPTVGFEPDSFDAVALAHSSWYLEDSAKLGAVLSRAREWAGALYFAEWDLQPYKHEQLAHFLAVMIQGQVEAFKADSSANVRSPLSKARLLGILEQTGWAVKSDCTLDASFLQDADWEISACLRSSLEEAQIYNVPESLRDFLESQVDVLRGVALPKGNPSLSVYALVAEGRP